jgi:undecaprenyl-diphosphatase
MYAPYAVLAAALWAAALALTRSISAMTGTPPADLELATTAHEFALANPWLEWVARLFALMGSGFILAPLTVLLVVVLYRRGQQWWALWLAAAGLGGVMISQTVKRVVDRPRPMWDNPLNDLTSPSFPSGHAMAGIYGYVALGMVAWFLLASPWNAVIGTALMLFGVLMGPSRVAFGVHWPSDVLGGWLYATAWLFTVTAALRAWKGPPPQRIAPGV